MARIRHIAISTDDPAKTAEFYKKFFGLEELRRKPADTGAQGVWLSDGYIYFAVLKHGDEDLPNLGPGHQSALKGVNHIGFHVDDLQETVGALTEANVAPLANRAQDPARSVLNSGKARNEKCPGPDGLVFEVSESGWDEAIRSKMQLYQLQPAPKDKERV